MHRVSVLPPHMRTCEEVPREAPEHVGVNKSKCDCVPRDTGGKSKARFVDEKFRTYWSALDVRFFAATPSVIAFRLRHDRDIAFFWEAASVQMTPSQPLQKMVHHDS